MIKSRSRCLLYAFIYGYLNFEFVMAEPQLLGQALPLPKAEGVPAMPKPEKMAEMPKPETVQANPVQAVTDIGTKKKPDIAGFLGMDDKNATVELKRIPPGSPPPEKPCGRSFYMGPFSKPITFSSNSTIASRRDPTCYWNIIGTEACIPLLSCRDVKMDNLEGECDEFLEVRDGLRGLQKFCGKEPMANISASEGLRDLYVKYEAKGLKDKKAGNVTKKFICTVECSQRGDGNELSKGTDVKTDDFCSCGTKPTQNRMVNGVEVDRKEFPWMAALVQAGTRQPFCGGTLLNNKMILTAAHCIKGLYLQVKFIEIVLGGHEMDPLPNMAVVVGPKPLPKTYEAKTLAALDAGNGSVRVTLDEIIVHPLYVAETNDYDVALLRLSQPINFQNYTFLAPACIPSPGAYLRTFAKRSATVIGWGLPGAEAPFTNTKLQKLVVNVFSPKECKTMYEHRVNRRMLCAGYAGGKKDSCMGDSGGPLITEDRSQVWVLIGSVSWGEGCAESVNPGVYIRTTEIVQWSHYHSNLHEASWCKIPGKKE